MPYGNKILKLVYINDGKSKEDRLEIGVTV